MRDRMRLMLVTVGGLGLIRRAPGTWGSIPPAALALALMLGGAHDKWLFIVLLALLVVSSALCVALTPWAERRFGRSDPRAIVLDEVAGQCLALLPVALIGTESAAAAIITALVAFALFRLFDITKPGLIDTAQRLPHGWGVLTDDLFAGAAAGGLLWVGLKLAA